MATCSHCGQTHDSTMACTLEEQHTAAYLQLHDVCAAASQDKISSRVFRNLLEDLEHYLRSEVARFQGFPPLALEQYTVGRDMVVRGLGQMKHAVSSAQEFETEDDIGILASSLVLALEADELIARGRQILEEARRLRVR